MAATIPTGQAIARDALSYQGSGYTYGGRADHPGDWDCSSYVSYILGHDFGLVLPGGGKYGDPAYPPNAHGPVVSAYAGWAGATQLRPGVPPAAGDLCVFNGVGPLGHIGIATSSTYMISALNHSSGTVHTPIAGYGPAGAPLTFHRINGAGQTGDTSSTGTGTAGALVGAALLGLSIPAVMVGALFIAATVIGAVGAAVITLALAKAARGS